VPSSSTFAVAPSLGILSYTASEFTDDGLPVRVDRRTAAASKRWSDVCARLVFDLVISCTQVRAVILQSKMTALAILVQTARGTNSFFATEPAMYARLWKCYSLAGEQKQVIVASAYQIKPIHNVISPTVGRCSRSVRVNTLSFLLLPLPPNSPTIVREDKLKLETGVYNYDNPLSL